MAVGRREFGNPERGKSAVGNRYQRAGEGQRTEKTQCMHSELSGVRNIKLDCKL
jgi:hypothetical protein